MVTPLAYEKAQYIEGHAYLVPHQARLEGPTELAA